MSTQLPQKDDEKATIATAIQEITERSQLLVREEIELAKAELQVKVNALKAGAIIGAAAGVFLLAALVMLLFGFAWLAYYVLPLGDQLSFFWGFFFVAGVLLILAAGAAFFAYRKFVKGTPPKPEMAIDEGKKIQATVNEARAAEVQR